MATFRYLLAAASGLALLATGSNALATPYAYGNINFSNLTLAGLQTGTVTGATVTTSSSASYLGLGDSDSSGPNNPGTGATPLTGGSDVRQSTAGTGPFPAQNTFGQALTAGAGTRGDAVVLGNLLTGSPAGSASDVAEGRLTVPGSASSTSGTTTGFSLTFTTTEATNLTLSFQASTGLIATTDAIGDGASAQINASFSVTGSGVNTIYSPDTLNNSVSSTSGQGNANVTTGLQQFGTTVSLGAGTYQISLLSGAQERLNATPAAVPEPASMALLGIGLAAAGLARRRRA